MTFDLNTPNTPVFDTKLAEPTKSFLTRNAPISLAPNAGVATPSSRFTSGFFKTQKYNEQQYEIELYLDNSGNFDKPARYFINPAAVLGLQITDTVTNWVAEGSLTFMYLPEGAPLNATGAQERSTPTGLEQAASENAQVLQSYEFRNDGFDLLRVIIVPKSLPGDDSIKVDKTNTKWVLSYLFSIYEVEDVNNVPGLEGPLSTYMKCLKVKFHDVRYQMLCTTNLEYSTAMPKDSGLTSNYTSGLANEGVLSTGDALRDVFNEALARVENGGCDEFLTMAGPDWDQGSGEIFYTSPAQYSAADDIDYLYAHHVSTKPLEGLTGKPKNDLCLLHTNRPSSFGLLEPLVLTPVSDFFKKAGKESTEPGELQKEHFFVTAHTKEEVSVTAIHKAPIGGNGIDIDVKTFKYGQIISYSFVDMSPTINSNVFCSTPVYSVDIGRREFNVEFEGNNISSARKAIAKTYISNLYKKGGAKEEDLFLATLHQSKKNINMFPAFSLNGDNEQLRQKNGLHHLIYTGLFQNACICFKTYGLTLRESGTFIGIDKPEGSIANDYNNKLHGQWFVVKVDHLFEAGAYMNIIYAIKLHRFDYRTTQFQSLLNE